MDNVDRLSKLSRNWTGTRDKFEKKFKKTSRRGSRSPDNAKFGHFTLLFAENGKEMYQEL